MNIKKAIIPAGGLGTRFLPVTKCIPKEMLPIIDTPAIQLIVQEAIDSGIEEILLILSSSKAAIINHFDNHYELEARLKEKNKLEEYFLITSFLDKVKISTVRQKSPNGLGNAISYGKSFVGNEPFAVLLGDDIIYHGENQKTALSQCIDTYKKCNASVVGVQKVEHDKVCDYGIIDPVFENGNIKVSNIIEKPSIDKAPSNYACLGRYVLTPDIFDILDEEEAGSCDEIQLTDAIKKQISNRGVHACEFEGIRYDIGNKRGFVIATIDYALRHEGMHGDILAYIKKIAKEEQ